VKASGTEFAGKKYAIRVSPLDCTGCNACVEACPEAPKALKMKSIDDGLEANKANWDYAYELPERGDLIAKNTIRGSQFQTPLMEFSGACAVSSSTRLICETISELPDPNPSLLLACRAQGCGETPYFKLLTQLFGERMLIANATGCSTIWGGSFPS
jgi:pyruvate-ferredoxin/flavodoxin oxidoreductase